MRQLAISEWTTMRVDHCAHAYGVAWTTHPSATSKPVHMVYSGDTRPCASIPLAVEYLREKLLHGGSAGSAGGAGSASSGDGDGGVGKIGDGRRTGNDANIHKDHCCVIHEATFEDDMQQDAILRKHSTWSEAVEVGRQSGAHELLLTHFSQRYPKLPSLPPTSTAVTPPAITDGDATSVNEGTHTAATTTNTAAAGTTTTMALGVAFDLMVVPVGRVPQTSERYHPALCQLYKEEF